LKKSSRNVVVREDAIDALEGALWRAREEGKP